MSDSMFHQYLLADEKVEWSGQRRSKRFTKIDFLLVPFSLAYFSVAVFSLIMASGAFFPAGGHRDPSLLLLQLFMIPFFLLGAYMLIGRFFYKNWKQKNTFYAVTNQRILITCTVPSRSLQAIFFKDIQVLRKLMNEDGTGTVIFAESDRQADMYTKCVAHANTGMEWFIGTRIRMPSAFYDIEDADKVIELINQRKDTSEISQDPRDISA